MTRLVKIDAKEPLKVTFGNESKFMCMCGLSKNGIFCDGTHQITSDEKDGKCYMYEDGQRMEVNC